MGQNECTSLWSDTVICSSYLYVQSMFYFYQIYFLLEYIILINVKINYCRWSIIYKKYILSSLFSYPLSEVKPLSHVRLFATPWTVAHQASPSMECSKHEYWSGLPFSSPGDRPDPGIEPRSPALDADALPSEPPGNLPLLPLRLMQTQCLPLNLDVDLKM